jgi:hypothetical protein
MQPRTKSLEYDGKAVSFKGPNADRIVLLRPASRRGCRAESIIVCLRRL